MKPRNRPIQARGRLGVDPSRQDDWSLRALEDCLSDEDRANLSQR